MQKYSMNKQIIVIGLIFVVLFLAGCGGPALCEPDVCTDSVATTWHKCSYDSGTWTWEDTGILINETSPC